MCSDNRSSCGGCNSSALRSDPLISRRSSIDCECELLPVRRRNNEIFLNTYSSLLRERSLRNDACCRSSLRGFSGGSSLGGFGLGRFGSGSFGSRW
jgi:hypothetical protein